MRKMFYIEYYMKCFRNGFNPDYALGIVMRSKIAINQGFSSEKHSTAMVTG